MGPVSGGERGGGGRGAAGGTLALGTGSLHGESEPRSGTAPDRRCWATGLPPEACTSQRVRPAGLQRKLPVVALSLGEEERGGEGQGWERLCATCLHRSRSPRRGTEKICSASSGQERFIQLPFLWLFCMHNFELK